MIEFITSIPGPTFLVLYAGVAVLGIVAGRLLARADGSTALPMPHLSRLTPYHVAVLQGGWLSLLHTILYSLWSRKAFTVEGEHEEAKMVLAKVAWGAAPRPVEARVVAAIGRNPGFRDLVKDIRLRASLESHAEELNAEMRALGLVPGRQASLRRTTIMLLVAGLLLLVGLTKLAIGLSRDKPVTFLVIEMIAAVIATWIAIPPGRGLTELGRRFLASAREDLAFVKRGGRMSRGHASIDPAWGMAVFGLSALAGVSGYSPFAAAFPKRSDSGTGCGGGTGCSSSSSSDGGGCGGGGCGGCGGCG